MGPKGDLLEHVRASDLPGVHVVPADFSLRHLDLDLDDAKRPTERLAALLAGVEDRYDVALLDCPPSISLASESVFGAADALLVPVIPTTLSSRTLHQLSDFLGEHESKPILLPYFSMVDGRKRLHRDLMGTLRAEWPGLLDTVIPSASAVERMGPERAPVGLYAPSSPAAEAFRRLWADITVPAVGMNRCRLVTCWLASGSLDDIFVAYRPSLWPPLTFAELACAWRARHRRMRPRCAGRASRRPPWPGTPTPPPEDDLERLPQTTRTSWCTQTSSSGTHVLSWGMPGLTPVALANTELRCASAA